MADSKTPRDAEPATPGRSNSLESFLASVDNFVGQISALSVGAARSHALQEADVIVLLGARLNWIMHFGLPPRFNKKVRIVQLDIAPEAIGQNVPAEVGLVGDGTNWSATWRSTEPRVIDTRA